MQYPKSSFFQKRGRNGIQSFNRSIKQPSNQATKQPSNQATKQPSNQATKQRYHTFITFTKIRLKIFYSLLFLFSLTHTAIFLKNLIR
ncbi:hypothetical protein C2S42_07400 [Helicobacter pylori]|nr:hypothetical protein C2S42_07400 [Helicobacter pylori]